MAVFVAGSCLAKDVERTPEQIRNAENFSIAGFTAKTDLETIKTKYPGMKLNSSKNSGSVEAWDSSRIYNGFSGLLVGVDGSKLASIKGYIWQKGSGPDIFRKRLFEIRKALGEPTEERDYIATWNFDNPNRVFSISLYKDTVSIYMGIPKESR